MTHAPHPGAAVKICSDHTAYTQGCYAGSVGVVRRVETFQPAGRVPLTLVYVQVCHVPCDDYAAGGWWYTPAELMPAM